jgi:putative ABC transport system permease protein
MRLKHVLRRLVQLPLFTTVAVATLAIGIGANTAIFSVVEGVLLKPLPFERPEELVSMEHTAPGVNLTRAGSAPFLHFTYRDESRTVQESGLWRADTVSVTGLEEPEEIQCLEVTDGVLRALGVQPAAGRVFTASDDAPGSPETAILTRGYWRTKFGGDPSAIGRRIMLDGRPREIIGVLPERFRFLDRKPAILVPLQLDRSKTHLGNFSYHALARLKPGVSIAQANRDAARVVPVALHAFPAFPGFTLKMFEDARLAPALRPLKDDVIGDIGPVLWVLMGTIGMVLLIACANVANLLLVRAESRQQELAIRAAIGAGWGDIARELLLESLTLAFLGGALGLALAYGAVRVITSLAPGSLPRVDEISIDGVVLLFTFGASLLAGLLFGAVPVLKYAGPHLTNALRGSGRTSSLSRERHRARSTLVVVQVALALVLLVGSGLMIRTFQAMRQVQPGFTRPEEVQTFRPFIPKSQVAEPDAVVRMEQAIADRLAGIGGVSSVGLSTGMPMTDDNWQDPIFAEDHAYAEGQIPRLRHFRRISPGLLKTMGNTLVTGRDFTWTDVYETRNVALVSENLARELWRQPGEAIGKRIRENLKAPWREVIGVVGDERDDGLSEPAPTVAFWPILMTDFEGDDVSVSRSLTYVVRSPRAGSRGLLEEINRAVWSINANLPVANVRTLQEIYSRSMARTSFTLVMLAIAGAMALLLGLAGIYAVISYSVSQRTREIGIRIALGARSREVVRLFVGHGLRLVAIGIACGIAVAVVLTRLMTTLLFNVSPIDPLTYGAVSLSLAAAALLASCLPTLRALAVDPVNALRAE